MSDTPYGKILKSLADLAKLPDDENYRVSRNFVMREVVTIRENADLLERENADLRAKLEAARKNAERYEKLLALTRYDADAWSVTLKINAPGRPIEFDVLRGQRLSIALDAAIAAGKGEK